MRAGIHVFERERRRAQIATIDRHTQARPFRDDRQRCGGVGGSPERNVVGVRSTCCYDDRALCRRCGVSGLRPYEMTPFGEVRDVTRGAVTFLFAVDEYSNGVVGPLGSDKELARGGARQGVRTD